MKTYDELREAFNTHKQDRNEDMQTPSFKDYVDEGAFDWKTNKSEIDWHSDDKKTSKSAEGGTIHHAREKARNPESSNPADKKGRGRPSGKYGAYDIDKGNRDSKEYKDALSKKVMAAKSDGFAARKEFKGSMDAAIRKRQADLH